MSDLPDIPPPAPVERLRYLMRWIESSAAELGVTATFTGVQAVDVGAAPPEVEILFSIARGDKTVVAGWQWFNERVATLVSCDGLRCDYSHIGEMLGFDRPAPGTDTVAWGLLENIEDFTRGVAVAARQPSVFLAIATEAIGPPAA